MKPTNLSFQERLNRIHQQLSPAQPAKITFRANLPVDEIFPNPRQPRRSMDPQALQELAESIALRGLLQPIMVRPREGGGYEIIYGERRWRAHKMMGRSTIPALIRNTDDLSSRVDALIENLQRENLNPVDEVYAILDHLMEVCRGNPEFDQLMRGMEDPYPIMARLVRRASLADPRRDPNPDLSQRILGGLRSIGINNPRSFVNGKLGVIQMPTDVKQALQEGVIAITQGKEVSTIKDARLRREIIEQAKEQVKVGKPPTISEIRQMAGKEPEPRKSLEVLDRIMDNLRGLRSILQRLPNEDDERIAGELNRIAQELQRIYPRA